MHVSHDVSFNLKVKKCVFLEQIVKKKQPTSAQHNAYGNSFNTIYKASHDAPLEVSLRECPDCAELESRQWINTLKKLK